METIEQRHDDVDPLDREWAPGWAPEAGDKIRGGFVAGPSWRKTKFGGYPVYTLELCDGYEARTKDGTLVTGEVAVHASRGVLERKLENAELTFGDEVGIKYQGPPRGTARSHRYRVVKYLPDGGFVEVSYDPDDELDASDEDQAATAAALESERDERDAQASEAAS